MKRTLGLSLLELMAAMMLGAFIVGAVFSVYLISQRNQQTQLTFQQSQSRATKAIQVLTNEIKQAGWIGCARLAPDFPIQQYSKYTLSAQNRIQGQVNELSVRYVQPLGVELIEISAVDAKLIVGLQHQFHANDVLVIADCQKAEIFKVRHVAVFHGKQVLTAMEPLHHQFPVRTEINRLVINRFFIAKTKDRLSDGTPLFALYLIDITGQKIRLVEGIYDLQFHYYLATNGQVSQTPQSAVVDATQLAAVEWGLSIQSSLQPSRWYGFAALPSF